MIHLKEQLESRWGKLLDDPALPAIKDPYRRAVTAVLLENEEAALKEANGIQGDLLNEDAPANQSNNFGGSNLKGFDPILIALVRRSMPNLIAYDVCGVQPMNGPTGLIFAMKSRYSTQGGTEALFNEANTGFSSANLAGEHTGTTPAGANSTNYTWGTGMTTLEGEAIGTSGNVAIPEMAFSIDKVTVTAVTRALKAEYTVELAQDLKAVHGLDAEAELANILSAEILFEMNREIIRTIGSTAKRGSQDGVTTAGTFDLDLDSSGRWSVEKYKGLCMQIEREANAIAKATRRGRGNVIMCSSDLASALRMAEVLDYTPALSADLNVDDTGNTFAGMLLGKYKVFIDPYAPQSATNYFIVGYKGSSPYDAGLFYCPYVPLQMMKAQDPGSFQPKIGFKTRYGVVANPFATAAGTGAITHDTNVYYRLTKVTSLL